VRRVIERVDAAATVDAERDVGRDAFQGERLVAGAAADGDGGAVAELVVDRAAGDQPADVVAVVRRALPGGERHPPVADGGVARVVDRQVNRVEVVTADGHRPLDAGQGAVQFRREAADGHAVAPPARLANIPEATPGTLTTLPPTRLA